MIFLDFLLLSIFVGIIVGLMERDIKEAFASCGTIFVLLSVGYGLISYFQYRGY